ncbi:MAG TPA: pyridoxal phosphate-dependent aminotransferase family protein, partial [Ignavibacteriaceae bacterium]|nr:pyridoxal phosphate-dependent aminotransferase family protein [Ignavibacteriaceae bacterium]
STGEMLCMRCISSPADREIEIIDPETNSKRNMLMFGSNNYLGLANHPYIKEKVKKAIEQFGAGIGGPPLLNGYTLLHKELEERLAAFKEAEDCLIFSSGYGANIGLVTALMNEESIVLYDAYSHASFCDGIKMSGTQSFRFPHNDLRCLEIRLNNLRSLSSKDIYVAVEGVYSMDGDLAPLDRILKLCRKYNAYLIIDDAHGTGMMGRNGKGSAEHFNVEGKVDITMGTFSKSFAATGGFVAASKSIINYLRFFARSYMFSASLPPSVVAAVLGSLDLIEKEPGLLESLHENIKYTAYGLTALGFKCNSDTAIFPLIVPETMNIRKASYEFHKQGIFVNSIEYPAVPLSQQRFRISIMASHKRSDIDRLLSVIAEVWNKFSNSRHELQQNLTAA